MFDVQTFQQVLFKILASHDEQNSLWNKESVVRDMLSHELNCYFSNQCFTLSNEFRTAQYYKTSSGNWIPAGGGGSVDICLQMVDQDDVGVYWSVPIELKCSDGAISDKDREQLQRYMIATQTFVGYLIKMKHAKMAIVERMEIANTESGFRSVVIYGGSRTAWWVRREVARWIHRELHHDWLWDTKHSIVDLYVRAFNRKPDVESREGVRSLNDFFQTFTELLPAPHCQSFPKTWRAHSLVRTLQTHMLDKTSAQKVFNNIVVF